MKDLVSVIIPCYNQARYLKEAVDSVLCQTYPSVEIIIVNDGSDDETAEVADAYAGQICVLHQSHQGRSAARNRGLDAAGGTYIKLLDADDKLDWQCLARQVAAMRNGVGWNESATFAFGNGPEPATPHPACLPEEPLWRRLLKYGGTPICAPLVHAALLEGVRFREDVQWGEDTLFWNEIWRKLDYPADLPFVPEAKCFVRSHAGQTHPMASPGDVLLFVVELVELWQGEFFPKNPGAVAESVERLCETAENHLDSGRPDTELHRRTMRLVRRTSKTFGPTARRAAQPLTRRIWKRRVRFLARPLLALRR